jgi:hypothetical protein
MRKIITGSH